MRRERTEFLASENNTITDLTKILEITVVNEGKCKSKDLAVLNHAMKTYSRAEV
jgi:hypothetical protein